MGLVGLQDSTSQSGSTAGSTAWVGVKRANTPSGHFGAEEGHALEGWRWLADCALDSKRAGGLGVPLHDWSLMGGSCWFMSPLESDVRRFVLSTVPPSHFAVSTFSLMHSPPHS